METLCLVIYYKNIKNIFDGGELMNREILFKELKELVKERSKSKQEITEQTNLIYDLGFDSILLIELFTEIEERYNAEFDFEGVDFEKIMERQKRSQR